MIAWRGVVLEDGTIWAWPMVLMDHETAFGIMPSLRNYRARWRQWSPGDSTDFDYGATPADQESVKNWIERANS